MRHINREISYNRAANGSVTKGKIVNGKIKLESGHLKSRHLTSVQQSDLVSKLTLEARKYFDKNKLEQASFLYQEALKLDSKNIEVINGLGLIAMRTSMLVLAAEFFNMAWEINPDDLSTNKNLALVYTRSSRLDEAILHNICVLNIDENNIDAHSALANLNMQQGDLDLALHHYLYAFELNPSDPTNLQGLVQIDASAVSKENISIIEKLLDSPDLSLDERCSYYFSLGKIYHVNGRYDDAFASYLVANISKHSKFDQHKHGCAISELINTFSRHLFDNDKFDNNKTGNIRAGNYRVADIRNNKLNNSSQPVFIVGMPCSGIDLVEKMLRDCPDVYSVGSLNQLQLVLQETGDIVESDLSSDSLHNLGRYYLNEINNIAADAEHKDASRIINTFSENYLQLGLIALLFPGAHIIHCVRDSFDTCLSTYFKNFTTGKDYSYDQQDITFYYQQYQRLMVHWHKVLPVNIHTVEYEDIVSESELTSKELFQFINIDWSADCRVTGYAAADKASKSEQSNAEVFNAFGGSKLRYGKYFRTLFDELSLNHLAATSGKPP